MEYCNSGQRWTDEEDEKLNRLYNIEKRDIGYICKAHKRFLGGITSRLQSKNYILISQEARGYNDFINSEEYKDMKDKKKELHEKKFKKTKENPKQNSYLITIDKCDYDYLKKDNDELKMMVEELNCEISQINYNVKELKDMIKKLDIYDFD
tara:strand:- start:746 stop:1201 length:456 start_codon:yes stop_codon:yes gene_type:complete